MKFSSIIIVLFIIIFSVRNVTCQESVKENTFVMATFRTENDYLGKWWKLTYAEVFKRLGIKIEFRYYPKKRVSIEADAGNIDGEAGRIDAYAALHPNLIRVEESIFYSNFSAFTAKDSIPRLKGWESLKGTDYRVEYQRGTIICEDKLPKIIRKENLSDVTEISQGLKKLISGRTDIFVDEESGVLTLLRTPEFKESRIHLIGIIEPVIYYPYLHKKHASLAPKIAEIIKAMKAEGLIEQYRIMVDKEFGFVRNQ